MSKSEGCWTCVNLSCHQYCMWGQLSREEYGFGQLLSWDYINLSRLPTNGLSTKQVKGGYKVLYKRIRAEEEHFSFSSLISPLSFLLLAEKTQPRSKTILGSWYQILPYLSLFCYRPITRKNSSCYWPETQLKQKVLLVFSTLFSSEYKLNLKLKGGKMDSLKSMHFG